MAKNNYKNAQADFFPIYPESIPAESPKTFKVCSLFSGCGGMDLGFVGGFEFLGVNYPKTGFEIVYANDFDSDAKLCYEANRHLIGDHWFDDRDVLTINNFEDIPDFEVLTAGFPCQPFSSAGNREGVLDKSGRGTLFAEVERFISNKKPLAFVLENVRGILTSKMPDGTLLVTEIRKRLSAVECVDGSTIKYNISEAKLLNASDYGVPQNRYRVFIVGIKDGLPPFTFDRLFQYVRNESMHKRTLREALKGVENLPNQNEVWDFSPQQMGMMKYIKRSWKDIPYEMLPDRFKRIRDKIRVYRAPNFYRRFGWDEIAGTITASAQPENCGILYPEETEVRRFTIREITRIQSFPDKWVAEAKSIPGKYKVIGNAVPPILGFIMACAIKELLSQQKGIPQNQLFLAQR
jgi:DNA (cytosine-5)-methyltransferase 1